LFESRCYSKAYFSSVLVAFAAQEVGPQIWREEGSVAEIRYHCRIARNKFAALLNRLGTLTYAHYVTTPQYVESSQCMQRSSVSAG
jgi:hypothetical protein